MRSCVRLRPLILTALLATVPAAPRLAPAAPWQPPMGINDLAGRWWLQYLPVGGAHAWVRGTANIAADGSMNGLLTTAWTSPLRVPFAGDAWLAAHGLGSLTFADEIEGETSYAFAVRPERDAALGSGATLDPPGLLDPPVEIMTAPLAMVKLDPAGYAAGDIAGRWAVYGIETRAGNPLWIRGTMNVAADGSISGEVADSNGASAPLSGILMIDSEGIVTTTLNASWEGALCAERDIIIASQTRGPDDFEFDVLVRMMPPYAIGALRGRFSVLGVAAGPDDSRAYGKGLIGSAGNFQVGIVSSAPAVVVDSGTLVYAGDGNLTRAEAPLWKAAACPSRSLVVGNRGTTGAIDIFFDVREPPEAFRITRIERGCPCGSNSIRITWTSFPGESYDLLTTTDPFTPPCDWTTFLTDIPAAISIGSGLQGETTREFPIPPDGERSYTVVVREPEE